MNVARYLAGCYHFIRTNVITERTDQAHISACLFTLVSQVIRRSRKKKTQFIAGR